MLAMPTAAAPLRLAPSRGALRRSLVVAAATSRRDMLLSAGSAALLLAQPASADESDYVAVEKLSKPYVKREQADFTDLLRTELRADEELAVPGAYRSCVRLLFNDAAGGVRDGSVHFPEELKRPENSGLAATVAALARVKAKVDAASDTKDDLSWADLIAFSVAVITRRDFRRQLAARYDGFLPPGITNEFAEPKLGYPDGPSPSPTTTVPPPGSPAAAWKQCFAALGLNNTDLAVLGPDVIGSDPAAAEALLASDPELAPTVATISKLMNAPGRTGYELAYAKAVNKLASLGRRDDRRYLFAIMRPDVAKLAQKLVVGG